MGIISKMLRWQNTSKKDQIVYDPSHEKITVAPGGILSPANKGEESYYSGIMKSNIFFAPAGPGQSAPGAGVSGIKSESGSGNGGGETKAGESKGETAIKDQDQAEKSDAISDQQKDGLKNLKTEVKETVPVQTRILSPMIGPTTKIEIETGGPRKRRPRVEREPEQKPVETETPIEEKESEPEIA